MSDKIKLTGVLAKGYGLAPKLVMTDEDLSIESKAIYCYISSFAGNGEGAFPSVATILHHLRIGKNRFYKHLKPLEKKGYITVIQRRKGNRRDSNLYKLNMELDIERLQFEEVQIEDIENEDLHFEDIQNEDSNNNNINNNNINNNNINNNNINNNSSNKNNYNNSSSFNENKISEQLLDEEIKELGELYQKCGFKWNGLTPDWLNAIKEEYGFEWSKNALLVAEKKGYITKSYVEGILRNWHNDGGMNLGLGGKKDESTSKSGNSSIKIDKSKFLYNGD